MRKHLFAIPLVLAGALLALPGPAQATDADVEVVGSAFTPAKVRVGLGDQVVWTFTDQTRHTSTSDEDFWDSGLMNDGQTFTWTFRSAGTFGYGCTPHPSMRGRVRVPVQAVGSPSDGWVLRWATRPAPEGLDYDVQVRRKGADKWTWFRRNAEKATGTFDPARSGNWKIRARTSNIDAGQSSTWSPTRSVAVS